MHNYTFFDSAKVSLSVPHTGTVNHYSALIPGAMWVWQKWSNSSCLLQLRLMDNPDPTKTYLYSLSQKKGNPLLFKFLINDRLPPGLEHFQNILLVSSEQDLYVPFHSARIEVCKDVLDFGKSASSSPSTPPRVSKDKGDNHIVSMVNNIWGSVIDCWRKRANNGEIVRY